MATQAQKDLVTNVDDLEAAEAGIVTDELSLTRAIANASKIFIANSFTLTTPVAVNKTVLINGNNQTLTSPVTFATGLSHNTTVVISANDVEVSKLTVNANSTAPGTWVSPARFAVQVNDATGVKLTDITLVNGQAGLLINAETANASVTANGIHTDGNGFGGIEVFTKTADLTARLDLMGTNTHDDLNGPAIWSEGLGTETVNAPGYTSAVNPNNNAQIYYTK